MPESSISTSTVANWKEAGEALYKFSQDSETYDCEPVGSATTERREDGTLLFTLTLRSLHPVQLSIKENSAPIVREKIATRKGRKTGRK
jgi:hypothetical protein